MTKSNDSLRQFVELRSSLERERTSLKQRLQQVETALSGVAAAAPRATTTTSAPASKPQALRRGAPKKQSAAPQKKSAAGAKGGRNSLGMRETITKLVGKNAMRIGD